MFSHNHNCISMFRRICFLSDVVTNLLDCDIKVNEFEHQLCYYFPFRNNTLRKGMNLYIPPVRVK